MTSTPHLRVAIYHGLPAGGAGRTAFEHAKRLSRKHLVAFFSLGSTAHNALDIRPHAERSLIVKFTPSRLFRSPFGRLNQALRIADLLRLRAMSRQMAAMINSGDYDAVLVHPCQYAHAPWILHFLDLPSVYYCQEPNRLVHEHLPARPYVSQPSWRHVLDGVDPLRYAYLRLLSWVEGRGLLLATRVLVNSKYVQCELHRIYGLDAPVCYHGVDLEEFPALDIPRGDYVVSVGAVTPRKGFDFIIEGLSRLPAQKRPRFVVVGYTQVDDERLYLESLAARLKVELEFVVMAGGQRLVDLYNRALITVYTPVNEPFGLVPLESMSCGTPVVGIAEGGVKETVVDGVTGKLVPRDPDALARAMAGLIENPKLRLEMGRAGRAHVEREWTWERATANIEQHLAEAAQARPRSARGDGSQM